MVPAKKQGKKSKFRARGEGWIHERSDGRVEAGLGIKTPAGTKYLRTTRKTREEADAWLTQKKHDRDTGTMLDFDAEKMTLEEYLTRWLRYSVKHEVGELTYEGHRMRVETHIVPALGTVKLGRLTPAHVQGLIVEKLEKGLSPGTVGNIHATLKKALTQAKGWRLVAYNVAEEVSPPAYRPREMEILSHEDARRFLAAAEGTPDRALWHLAIRTGMRLGEMLALRWKDLELKESGGMVHIRRSVTTWNGRVRFGPPKAKSVRAVEIGAKLSSVLREHQQKQRLLRMRTWNWEDREGEDLVFPGTGKAPGSVMRDVTLRRHFYALLDVAGVRRIRIHDLRHTAATHMLESGEQLLVVSRTLGHKNIHQTASVYAHVTPMLRRQAAERMDALYK